MRHASCERCGYPLLEQVWDGCYEVERAFAILGQHPRASVLLHRTRLIESYVHQSVGETRNHIDHVDARRPVIVVPKGHKYVVIDGNHRAAKQLRRGDTVRAYVMTAKEAKRIKGDK